MASQGLKIYIGKKCLILGIFYCVILGFVLYCKKGKNMQIEVISENNSGLILMIKGSKIALNKGMANKIIVQ